MSSLSEQPLDRVDGQGAYTGDDLREAPGPWPWQQSSLGSVPPGWTPAGRDLLSLLVCAGFVDSGTWEHKAL